MKKISILLLLVITALCFTSCKYRYVQSEEIYNLNYTGCILQMHRMPLDMAIRFYFDYYPTDDTTLYVPVSGEYETPEGEHFTTVVGEYAKVYFLEDTKYSRLGFEITILDENGEVIVKKDVFNSYVEAADKTEPDLTYVSEDFAKYWQIIAVRIDELP